MDPKYSISQEFKAELLFVINFYFADNSLKGLIFHHFTYLENGELPGIRHLYSDKALVFG